MSASASTSTFADRRDAGRRLAERLVGLVGEDLVVLGLPRGGVTVAAEVARRLDAPLDVVVVRKLGVPGHAELAMGAIGEGGVRVLDARLVGHLGVRPDELGALEERERVELDRRVARVRAVRAAEPLAGRVVVIVDDGIATGATARAACAVVRARGPRRVVLAVPVAPPHWDRRLGDAADAYVAVATPEVFAAVGQFYVDFRPVTDDEVLAALRAPGEEPTPDGRSSRHPRGP